MLLLMASGTGSYDGEVVLRLTSSTSSAAGAIVELERSDRQLDFLSDPGPAGSDIYVRVAGARAPALLAALRALGVGGSVAVADLGALVDAERGSLARADGPWGSVYHSYGEIVDHFNRTAVPAASRIGSTFSIGRTHEGRDLLVVRVTGGGLAAVDGVPVHNGKPAVWVQALLHAREHLTGGALAHLADRLLREYGADEAITTLGERPTLLDEGSTSESAASRAW